MSALPLTIEAVSREWLAEALGCEVRSASIEQVIHGTCTKVRLRVETAPGSNVPEHLILKGGFEPHSRAMHYTHQHEVRAYSQVMPVLGLRSPACLFAAYDPDTLQGVVIMEDLTARGVRFCDPQRPESVAATTRRIEALARFHARTWGSGALEPGGQFDWVPDVFVATGSHFGPMLVPETWGHYINLPRGAAVSSRFHDLDWHRDALARMARFGSALPHCVLHGDTHLGNLYVEPDGTPGFFDPQTFRAPGMVEVTYHLACALDLADRRGAERDLVARYLAVLAEEGATAPSLDEAMHQFGVFLVHAWNIFIFNATDFQTEAVNTAYTARIGAAMLDHDTIGLVAAL